MNFGLITYALRSLGKRQLRSWLTIISVAIGITAITGLISFGLGISSYVSDISDKMGNDKLIIQPRGFGFGPPSLESNVKLDDGDLEAIRDVRGVEEATGVYLLSGEISFHDQIKYGYTIGSDYEHYTGLIQEVYNLDVAQGRPFTGREKNKVFLGHNYGLEEKIFDKAVRLRDTVLVNGKEMTVAGFYDEVGNPQDDSNVYMNVDAVDTFFNPTSYYYILVRATKGYNPSTLAESIREELRQHRNQQRGNEDFFVQTFEQIIAAFTSVLGIITGVVILIAFISILVAGVNIMNTTYAAILERTKEIGVFKAIGAKNRDILLIFLLEAGLLSLAGGIVGVMIGYVVSVSAGSFISQAGYSIFKPAFPASLVIGSLVFAFLIGFISAFIPARYASKLQPVEALRYE